MHPVHPQNPGLLQLATQAQNLASNAKHERLAFAFQTVATVSVAVMGITAAANLVRDLLRPERTHGRGRG